MKLERDTASESDLYQVWYEPSADAPHMERLHELTIVRDALGWARQNAERHNIIQTQRRAIDRLALRIWEIEEPVRNLTPDLTDLLQQVDASEPPTRIHTHTIADLALIAISLRCFVDDTEQFVAAMRSGGAPQIGIHARYEASEQAANMHKQFGTIPHIILSQPADVLEANTQLPYQERPGQYL